MPPHKLCVAPSRNHILRFTGSNLSGNITTDPLYDLWCAPLFIPETHHGK